MFGLGNNKSENADRLSVQVHVVAGDEVFAMAQKLWDFNVRSVRVDEQTRKEFLHFGYANPKCVVWLQRDQGRMDTLELIVRWEADKTHEVFALTKGRAAGDVPRAQALLNSMLTTPSVVPSSSK